jgi:hypothetical protein
MLEIIRKGKAKIASYRLLIATPSKLGIGTSKKNSNKFGIIFRDQANRSSEAFHLLNWN